MLGVSCLPRCLWSIARLQAVLRSLPIQGFKSALSVRTCVYLFACVCMHVCQWVGMGKCINSMCVDWNLYIATNTEGNCATAYPLDILSLYIFHHSASKPSWSHNANPRFLYSTYGEVVEIHCLCSWSGRTSYSACWFTRGSRLQVSHCSSDVDWSGSRCHLEESLRCTVGPRAPLHCCCHLWEIESDGHWAVNTYWQNLWPL